jgi:hypothetical protein
MFKFKPIALAVALTGLGPAMLLAPVSAADIHEKVTVAPGKSINPREEAIISSAGVKVLRHIAQARSDIHDKDAEGAQTTLSQAEKLFDIIQTALPTTKVKDRIWVAKKHLDYEDTEEVLPDLIPIYTSLDELVDIMPVDLAKKHLEQAKEHLKSGDKKKAREALEATDTALQYTEIDLPLSTTRQLVAQAKADLDKEKLDDADKALKSAEHGVVYLSADIEQPLFMAKALLWQTILDLKAGDNNLAKTDLQSAIGYLETASQSNQKPTQEAGKQLLEQAKQLQEDLTKGGDVGVKLRHLWERAQAFADRSMEYLTTGWARYRAKSPLKSDLIEAKLHLTNAKIELFTGHETSQVKQELTTSLQYLEKAAEKTKQQNGDKTYTKKIDEMQKAIKELSTDPAQGKQARYFELQRQMRGMIRSL